MFNPQLVLIDLDGTLVDSVPDLANCVDQMMVALGRSPWGEDRVRNWVGNGVETLVKRALTGQLEGEPDPEQMAKAYPLFLDCYAKNNSVRSRLYSGVKTGLDYLKPKYLLGCVTNKAEQFTLPLLKNLGIADYFGLVVAGDTLPQKKPDPAPLLYACRFFNVLPENALMVGDSKSDIAAARAAGFAIICMSYGYNHGEDIAQYQPDEIIDSMEELRHLI